MRTWHILLNFLLAFTTLSKFKSVDVSKLKYIRNKIKWESPKNQFWIAFKVKWCPFSDYLRDVLDEGVEQMKKPLTLFEVDW